jgi:hypothetical protein
LDFAEFTNEIIDYGYIVFDTVCAIGIIPDTSWINKEQKSMDESDWNTIVSDNGYYQYIAIDTLEKCNIQIKSASRDYGRFIKLIKSNGNEFVIDLWKIKDAWGLILFNEIDNPVLWSSTDIENELSEIYNK